MARGGHELPAKFPSGPPCPTLLLPFQGCPARRASDLRPSSTPLDSPRLTPMDLKPLSPDKCFGLGSFSVLGLADVYLRLNKDSNTFFIPFFTSCFRFRFRGGIRTQFRKQSFPQGCRVHRASGGSSKALLRLAILYHSIPNSLTAAYWLTAHRTNFIF